VDDTAYTPWSVGQRFVLPVPRARYAGYAGCIADAAVALQLVVAVRLVHVLQGMGPDRRAGWRSIGEPQAVETVAAVVDAGLRPSLSDEGCEDLLQVNVASLALGLGGVYVLGAAHVEVGEPVEALVHVRVPGGECPIPHRVQGPVPDPLGCCRVDRVDGVPDGVERMLAAGVGFQVNDVVGSRVSRIELARYSLHVAELVFDLDLDGVAEMASNLEDRAGDEHLAEVTCDVVPPHTVVGGSCWLEGQWDH
jgi:hypothetical protein